MRNIYLVGFMGSGKSSAGRLLAARTGLAFKDSDDEIKKTAGIAPAAIINRRGLKAFRRHEDSALRKIARADSQVAALGGGATPAKRRSYLARTGVTVYLACSEKVLLKRLTACDGERPLLGSEHKKVQSVISRLFKKRRPYYERADITIDVSRLTPSQAAARIEAAVRKYDRHFFKA